MRDSILDTRTISSVTISFSYSHERCDLIISTSTHVFTLICTCVCPIVPVVGTLCGNAITASGISISLGYILKELECVIFLL